MVQADPALQYLNFTHLKTMSLHDPNIRRNSISKHHFNDVTDNDLLSGNGALLTITVNQGSLEWSCWHSQPFYFFYFYLNISNLFFPFLIYFLFIYFLQFFLSILFLLFISIITFNIISIITFTILLLITFKP